VTVHQLLWISMRTFIFIFIFIFICLNGVQYYVLLEWAPALMGVSPSGCLHAFFSANKLSPLAPCYARDTASVVCEKLLCRWISQSLNFAWLWHWVLYPTVVCIVALLFTHCFYSFLCVILYDFHNQSNKWSWSRSCYQICELTTP